MNDQKITTIWQGGAWRLVSREMTLPNGKIVGRKYIDHPGAVVIVPLLDDQVVMIQQYRVAIDREILELPAGTRHPNEDWVICAQRELREETGYRAEQLIPLGTILPGPGVTNELMGIFLAKGLTPDPLPADVDEQITIKPMALDDLLKMALDGSLEDAKSIVALWRANNFLGGSGV